MTGILSQARDLHELLTAQSAFVQKKIDMFAGGAKALTDVVAMPGTVIGGYTRTRAMAQARRGHRTQFAQLRGEDQTCGKGDAGRDKVQFEGRVLNEDKIGAVLAGAERR